MFSLSKVLRQTADQIDKTSDKRKKIVSDVCRVTKCSINGLKEGFNKGIQGGQNEAQVKKQCVPCPDSCGTTTPETCPIIKALKTK